MRIFEYNKIVGLVDYGELDCNKASDIYTQLGLATLMRCKHCGGAWMAENHFAGRDFCPFCDKGDGNVIPAPEI